MLEYVAAANAAYSVIRRAIENGKELHTCAKQIGEFTLAQDKLKHQGQKKKNSIWSAFAGTKDENDIEEFMHLEAIREKEEELKRMMIYLGRPGLHSDYIKFCVEARKKRQQAEIDRKKKVAEFWSTVEDVAIYGGAFLIIVVVVVFFVWIAIRKGLI